MGFLGLGFLCLELGNATQVTEIRCQNLSQFLGRSSVRWDVCGSGEVGCAAVPRLGSCAQPGAVTEGPCCRMDPFGGLVMNSERGEVRSWEESQRVGEDLSCISLSLFSK